MVNYKRIPANEMVFKIKADFLRSIAHPARLAVIEHLKKGESSVGEMVHALGIEQSGLSKHLSILKQSGILVSRQEKLNVYYSIRDRDIFRILRPIAEILRKKLRESAEILDSLGKD